ncbi:MAG TPA: hypothetical protein VJ806_06155 [Luteimonas sp.]|nr:hypothetical protein [Luteimonas sp.]
MSIERNRSSDSTHDAQRAREAAQKPAVEPKQPPSPETVDQFRAVMRQAREGESQQSLQAQTRQQARAADARTAVQTASDYAVHAKGLADNVEDNSRRRGDELGTSSSSQHSADAASMFQAQLAMREGAAQPQVAAPAPSPQGLAELIEKHVRQLAVDDSAARDSDGQVLLRMADATLPGTDLLLSRTADGWALRADVRSRASYDAIREAAPELAKRFAERNLGTLSIDPHFHG